MVKLRILTAALVCAAVISIAVSGCASKSNDGMTAAQQQQVDQTTAIFKKSTDWNSLSQADKDALTKSIGYGNPKMAEDVFSRRPLPASAKDRKRSIPTPPAGKPVGQ